MTNLTPEMIEKAKAAKTAEELMALAKENDIEMTEEEAKTYFAQLHPASGELSDDELDNVAGGGCDTSVGGKKYTVVSSGLDCFNGHFENYYYNHPETGQFGVDRADNKTKRLTWACFSGYGKCGNCRNLEFDGATGYCGKS